MWSIGTLKKMYKAEFFKSMCDFSVIAIVQSLGNFDSFQPIWKHFLTYSRNCESHKMRGGCSV